MLWEIELSPNGVDLEARRVAEEYALSAGSSPTQVVLERASRGFLVRGDLTEADTMRLIDELLIDPLVETCRAGRLDASASELSPAALTVLPKPGVMDPAAMSVMDAAKDLGLALDQVRTFRRYYATDSHDARLHKVICNEAIEQLVRGRVPSRVLDMASAYHFEKVVVAIRSLGDDALLKLSKTGGLSLSLDEMRTIQSHYEKLGREPSDIELETIAQTWSEHCSHKTLKGEIDFERKKYSNLLKETIFGATETIRVKLGADDWCVSVFEDNAGVIQFDEKHHICFKVETHNHPSAIEPYGGANTGLGGVIRDPLGTGLGAKPICNTDVFCFAPLDTDQAALPPGVLHPMRVMRGVVAGVRDYGNRIGIPTVNGAVYFDERYLGNPLVYCGTVGLIPVDRAKKAALPGDLIVAVGGRTGRDGIHGATFSSVELNSESEKTSSGAVQIGNPITEKKMLDVLLQARDRGLYHAITDCGAGGFSSAVGEMGEKLGAEVHIDKAPLKYEGLSYTEIWISEAQERMILAVPGANWKPLHELCASEGVEATILGAFSDTGKLRLHYESQLVGELEMSFLHSGRPRVVRSACWTAPAPQVEVKNPRPDFNDILLKLLASPNIASKEWIIRRYDHEVQGGTVIKPLVGVRDDGPSDAAVITPVLGSYRGIAIGCGLNPRYGDLDPYAMAAAAIDEAVRNVVAVGADPARIALLDNFCWANTNRPEVLGSLVRAAEACRDVALAFGMPFISGKDSLNNEFHHGDRHILIPPTLLISALGIVPDVRKCVTMDLKQTGSLLYLIGATKAELGGSHYHLVRGLQSGCAPQVDLGLAPRLFSRLHDCIRLGRIRSCHDLSEGGLAVALAEMAFAGGIGADIAVEGDEEVALFSESTSRFLVEVRPEFASELEAAFADLPCRNIGTTVKEQRLRVAGGNGEWIIWTKLADLRDAWQKLSRSLC